MGVTKSWTQLSDFHCQGIPWQSNGWNSAFTAEGLDLSLTGKLGSHKLCNTATIKGGEVISLDIGDFMFFLGLREAQ